MKRLHILMVAGSIILLLATSAIGCRPRLPDKDIPSSMDEPPSVDETETVEPMGNSGYVKFEGIDGESQNEGHEGWTEIIAFTQEISSPSASITTTRRRGEINFQDIVIVKELDKASPKLAEAMCKGSLFPKVEIHLTGPSESSTCQGTFYIYELTNVMITNYKVSGSNPLAYALIAPIPESTMPPTGPFIAQAVDAPMEEISLNFEEIKVTYTECDPITGKAKGNVEYSWKIETSES